MGRRYRAYKLCREYFTENCGPPAERCFTLDACTKIAIERSHRGVSSEDFPGLGRARAFIEETAKRLPPK
jgi:hypothetical protein